LDVTIVIPALNEEDGIGTTIERIPIRELNQLGYQVRVVVVDGCSTDRTKEIATRMGASVVSEPRRGYGRAYKTGFANLTSDVIITTDADGTYPVETIPKLLELVVKDKFDFVTTNRLREIEDGAMKGSNGLGNAILSFCLRFLFSLPISDSQSGMWAIRRNLLTHLELTSDGMSFSEEIKIAAFRTGKATEIPIRYGRRLGRQKLRMFRDGLTNFLYLLLFRVSRPSSETRV
jgi:glycosyltransferase involved in cell wall biosynthesis